MPLVYVSILAGILLQGSITSSLMRPLTVQRKISSSSELEMKEDNSTSTGLNEEEENSKNYKFYQSADEKNNKQQVLAR